MVVAGVQQQDVPNVHLRQLKARAAHLLLRLHRSRLKRRADRSVVVALVAVAVVPAENRSVV